MDTIDNSKKNDLLKSNLPFIFEQNDVLMSVIFQSAEYNFSETIICKDTLIFNEIENYLYKRQPKAKTDKNYFLVNGSVVNKYNSLKENKIKNGDIIIVCITEQNNK